MLIQGVAYVCVGGGGQDRECERILARQVSLHTRFDPGLPRMCERVNCVSPARVPVSVTGS